jgi:outer membrane protein OmpA-like peptidoglycan-associated protein
MDGKIIEESSSYRHGVVLGLTMAEIMLLLVFCLLIAMATVLTIEEAKRVEVEESLHREQATNREDQELVAAIKRNPSVLGTLRSAVHSGDGGAVDEFWRELVDSRAATAEFKKDGISPNELRDRVAAVDKLKDVGIDVVGMFHDPELIERLRKAISSTANPSEPSPTITNSVGPGRDDGPSGHQWPPIIALSEADGHFFKIGSAELSPEFRQELIDSWPERIAARMKEYGVDVIEVVGHTDEQPLGARQSNLDRDLLSVLRSEANIANLIPADNAGLGLARAVSVVSVLRKSKTLAGYKLIPLSGAQLVNIDESLAIAGSPGDIPERRRIEIRLRKSAPHESSPAATTLPVAWPKPLPARPKVLPPGPFRSATPAVAPRTATPSASSGPDARNRPWWQLF